MCQQTVEKESLKAGQYEKIIFVEFIEYACRLLYTKFKTISDANLIEHQGEKPEAEQLAVAAKQKSSTNNSARQRAAPKDDQHKKEAHEKHIYAFKEWCCTILDPYFEQYGLEFIDPDEDVALSDSQESTFVYDLPEGYDSGDPNNPSEISFMSSGNSSLSDEENDIVDDNQMPKVEEMSNIARMSIGTLGSKIQKMSNHPSKNSLELEPQKQRAMIRV